MMRGAWIWVVLLLAAAVVGWMVFGGGDRGGGAYEAGPLDEGDEPGPALRGTAGEGGAATTARVPGALRGGCVLQGVTRRGGAPTPATVELRHVASVDADQPFGGGMETQLIARMLDGGMSGSPVIARATTGADGRFTFQGLATGLYEVRATADDGALGFTNASLPADGARVEASVDIPDGEHALTGRVVFADGRPFRGSVLASMGNAFAMLMGGSSRSLPATTDEEGRFRIAGLAPGQIQVSALIPGSMRVMGSPFQVPYDGEYVLTINAVGTEVKGTVLDAETEQAIAGATVFGGGGNPEADFAIFTARTDAQGAFSITVPAGRAGGMFARADGYAARSVEFAPGRDTSQGVTIPLLRLGRLTGRVTARTGGAPVAGITVFAVSGQQEGFMGGPSSAVSDADGRYVLEGIGPGSVRVWALGGGFASVGLTGTGQGPENTPYTAELEPGAEATLDLEAVPSARVAGRVTTEDGRPVVGAVVAAGGGSERAVRIAAQLGLFGSAWGAAVTDVDGAYAIDVLVPGSDYRLTVRAPDHPDAVSEKFTAVGGKTGTVDVTMQAPRWLEVRVVASEGGAPISGAGVAAVPADESDRLLAVEFFGGAMWTTDGEGRARIGPLPGGALKVRVDAPGRIAVDDHEVAAGESGPITIELAAGLVVGGRVVLPQGVPVQGVVVTVQRSDPSGWFHERVPVQPDGTWRIDTIEHPGTYDVTAKANWKDDVYGAEAEVAAGTADLVLTLERDERERPERVEITVLDADGKPVPTGRVTLTFRYANGSSSTSTQLSGGVASVRVPGVGDTPGELWVEVQDLIGARRGATIQGPVTIEGGKLEVRLPEPRTIRGSVTDGQGAVGGVRVTAKPIHPGGGGRHGSTHAATASDPQGRFELQGLGDLEYRLEFAPPPDYAPVDAQTVPAGATDVRVSLTRGHSVTLTVLDPEGKPLPGAFVWGQQVDDEGNTRGGGIRTEGRTTTDGKGVVVLRGLVPGSLYSLRVNPPGGREDLKAIALPMWKPRDETLRFVRAYTIQGIVVDPAGKPIAEVNVQHRKVGTDSWRGWSPTNAKGEFTIEQLEAGTYELKVDDGLDTLVIPVDPGGAPGGVMPIRPGAAPEERGHVKARAGAKGVLIKADLGGELIVTIRGGRFEMGGRTASLVALDGSASLDGDWQGPATVRFRGLREGKRYRLWIHGLADGKYVSEGPIDGSVRTLAADAREGGVLEGTVKRPAGVGLRGIYVTVHGPDGRQLASAQADLETGRFRLEGLPPDQDLSVHAHGWMDEGGHYMGTTTGRPGAALTIDLVKR